MITKREALRVINRYDLRGVDDPALLLRIVVSRIERRVEYPEHYVGGPITQRNHIIPLLLLCQYFIHKGAA